MNIVHILFPTRSHLTLNKQQTNKQTREAKVQYQFLSHHSYPISQQVNANQSKHFSAAGSEAGSFPKRGL